MARWLCPTAPGTSLLKPSISLLHQKIPKTQLFNFTVLKNRVLKNPFSFRCSSSTTPSLSGSESDYETEEECVSEYYDEEVEGSSGMVGNGKSQPPVRRRRRRYRKQYPGEMKGITEEMRFVAMKLRNNGKKKGKENSSVDDKELEKNGEKEENFSLDKENYDNNQNGETWQPSMEGFLKYLVDSKLVFSTVERIVDQSSDVSYVYFRKTGLERSECLSKDLEWFSQQDNVVPHPSNPGVMYAKYLEELAEKSPPLFLCHFYNIYFSHIAGGQVIAKQVSKTLLEERELEFYQWEGDAEELLKRVRNNLNALGEHWSRDEKNKCLREATKAFRYLGQIVRLIIL
ncbi:probable inactive heme oxygenase 2, chloroplastic [Olea europaea subsp. europaea]|uniref:Probable inactive heme oxygenase 2, chloroplastic n=1 Tax=Olea europaea subsp. europaea TaxID=158383 RepID=A0A8S0U505_OLEEU|nr:probable inactive heme oxygenase 2, chloroplastic [Olea europaea subsp. europaea]